jgi:hypothetical protein
MASWMQRGTVARQHTDSMPCLQTHTHHPARRAAFAGMQHKAVPGAGPRGPGTPAVIEAYASPLSFCGLLTPGVCHADILLIDKSKLASDAPEIALDGGPTASSCAA